ncbi:MAG TPA: hypothetical protein VE907_04070 [Gammaproteobacteria bacterium]|nr:hypothetical protein [Gammaproteobacteria bacterium]
MTTRREVVRGGAALATYGAFASRRLLAAHAPISAAPALTVLAIADRSFDAASADFAGEVWRHGIHAQSFDGDVGGLWLHALEPALRAGGGAIVGLSGAGVLFCLETMARSYGFGPKFRAERPPSGGADWTRVAARHALAAATAGDSATLAPFEHVARQAPASTSPAWANAPASALFAWPSAPLFTWAIARATTER